MIHIFNMWVKYELKQKYKVWLVSIFQRKSYYTFSTDRTSKFRQSLKWQCGIMQLNQILKYPLFFFQYHIYCAH